MRTERALARIVALIVGIACILTLISCEETKNEIDDVFYVNYKGVKIELAMDASDVLQKLGEAKSVKELGDCGGLGAQVKYTYEDIELFTVKSNTGESIDAISFLNDIVTTPKNICLGDSSDKVITAYGEPTQKSNTEFRYIKDDFVLKFKIVAQKVEGIEYLRITN